MRQQKGKEAKMELRKLGREGILWIKQHLLLFLLLFVVPVRGQSKDGCPNSCGGVAIPYPFGTKKGCYHDLSFFIDCSNPDKPFIMDTEFKVLNISLDGEIRTETYIAYSCYNSSGNVTGHTYAWTRTGSYFTVSNKRNKFTAIGCDTIGFLNASGASKYMTGCMSFCYSKKDITSADGSCSGIGCCQIPIPGGVKAFNVSIDSFRNHTAVYDINPCSYAFVVEDGYFNFSLASYLKYKRSESMFPVSLDWAIGGLNCEQVGNLSVCSENSDCKDSTNQPGYLCKCRNGYEGNPFLPNGCQDVDECARGTHNCTKSAICQNTYGSFNCHCPKDRQGDPTKDCIRKNQHVIIILGTTTGSLIFLLGLSCLALELRRRKHFKVRERFFEQNGGFMLRSRIQGTHQDITIFTVEDLENATDNYHESRILGEGGQGTVYKGILPDSREVAIKKARIGDLSQVENFINEIIMLSQINHRNVVKLLGCCLETEVPLLIYEFVSNGTLFDHLHSDSVRYLLPWKTRLKIAIEAAGVFSYLHSCTSVPIIHRDIKSANILLDDKFTTKLADFGSSRLIPTDQEELLTLVQGTLGYLDPEYFTTGMLNEKSDVYSFGVVLMELISGQKAVSFNRPQNARHLVTHLASALAENRFGEVLDSRIAAAENRDQLYEVGRLAVRCTRVKGEERPNMKQVASELEGLRATEKHPWTDLYPEEAEYLLDGHTHASRE